MTRKDLIRSMSRIGIERAFRTALQASELSPCEDHAITEAIESTNNSAPTQIVKGFRNFARDLYIVADYIEDHYTKEANA